MVHFTDQEKQSQARLSQAAAAFLEHVEQNPQLTRKDAFDTVAVHQQRYPDPIQPWPTFISSAHVAEMADLTATIDGVIKGCFKRHFDGDPKRIAEFLSLPVESVELMLEEPNGMQEAISRADCILTPQGFKCMELNCGSHVWGWQVDYFAESVRSSKPVAQFIQQQRLQVNHRRAIDAVFRYLLDLALAKADPNCEEIRIAIPILSTATGQESLYHPWAYKQRFMEIAQEHSKPIKARLIMCQIEDLQAVDGRIQVAGLDVHLIFEQQGDATPFFVLRAAKMGQVVLVTGPSTALLLDKRLFALISDEATNGFLSAAEREKVARYVPWTRVVARGTTRFQNEEVELSQLIETQRARFVLKDATSGGGKGVFVGCRTAPAKWQAAIENALESRHWIIQEYLPCEPFQFQHGEDQVVAQDLVWGLIAVNGAFAGTYARMMPTDGTGVVNASQGAGEAIALEVQKG